MKALIEKLQGFKTYVLLAIWLLVEVAALGGWIDSTLLNQVRVLVLPLLGMTVNAKLNRTLQ